MVVNFTFLLFLAVYVFVVVKKSYDDVSLKSHKYFLLVLVVEHFLLMVCGFRLTEHIDSNDAYRFYTSALNGNSWFDFLKPGSDFFTFLIYPLVKVGLSMFSLFCLLSALSLLAFLKYFKEYTLNSENSIKILTIPVALWLLLLPSFHFWSGLLGKDALIFFFLTFLIFEIKENRLYTLSNALILLLILVLRPHFFMVIFGVLLVYFALEKNISVRIKLYVASFSAILVLISFPIIKFFLHFQNFSLQSINKLVKEMNFLANASGSGVGLDETNYVERIWLLLFRPLFYDAESSFQTWISIENTMLLLILIFILFILFKKPRKIISDDFRQIYFSIGISVGLILLISIYIYNLGLASRMRLMFYPLLIYGLHRIVTLQKREK